jgi:hypothetical protein
MSADAHESRGKRTGLRLHTPNIPQIEPDPQPDPHRRDPPVPPDYPEPTTPHVDPPVPGGPGRTPDAPPQIIA